MAASGSLLYAFGKTYCKLGDFVRSCKFANSLPKLSFPCCTVEFMIYFKTNSSNVSTSSTWQKAVRLSLSKPYWRNIPKL